MSSSLNLKLQDKISELQPFATATRYFPGISLIIEQGLQLTLANQLLTS